jgi:hypothetical protein
MQSNGGGGGEGGIQHTFFSSGTIARSDFFLFAAAELHSYSPRFIFLFKGAVQRDLRGGQKWYHSIGLPLSYQRFALDFNFIRPPS